MPSSFARWAGFGIRLVNAVAAFAILVLGGLVQLEVFKPSKSWAVVLVCAVSLITLVDSTRSAYRIAKAAQREHADSRVASTVMGLSNSIGHSLGLDFGVVGGSVFVAQRRWTLNRSIFFLRRPVVLVRPPQWRIRYGDGPQASRVLWTTDKGAVGEAYRSGSPVYKYWSPIAKRYGVANTIDEARFDGLEDGVKSGFTYGEFTSIVGKYAEILAVPIMSVDGGRVLGVFAIDRPYRRDEQARKLFDHQSIARTVESAASVVGPDL
ncbi:hypothetical protein [Rhodococcus erythropolis]|uniref:hypothetical protein n=1 Tax=Rhodococcus erythropolis TaxID=1833 RepID=UPI0024B82303|nr:hypothetical protein [Rhodococcus erythropolis]MDJ0014958.1 hypothetical protein [Rhodococcus erythropolis]